MFKSLLTIPRAFVAPDQKRISLLGYLFLLTLCLGFFTPGIATLPPTDRDESSFAQASKQMIESGDATDIRLQNKPRYQKPIGIYWLQSAAVRVLNPHHLNQIWAYRAPSVVGATLAVLMTAALGALLFGPAAGLMAALMLVSCVLLNVEARLAKTDAALLACIVTAQYALARAYMRQATGWLIPLLFWTAMAAGILIKGPIILLPILGTLLWLGLSDGTVAWFRGLRPLCGVPYMLALVLPWFVAIALHSHGAFVQASAGQDMLAKIWQGQNRGIVPPGMHVMALPIVFFPFSLFVFFAAPDAWKNRSDPAIKFCLGWLIPAWIVFEMSLTKLPHYVLPTYPALAVLTAKIMLDGFPSVVNARYRLPVALMVGLWLMIGTGFAAAFALLPILTDNGWAMPQIGAGVVLMLAQGAALILMPRDKIASVSILATGALIFMATTFGSTVPNLRQVWLSRDIVDAVARHAPGRCPHTQIIATGYHEPSLVFLGGTDTILASDGAEAARDMQQAPCRVAIIDAKNQASFLSAFANQARQPAPAATIAGLNSGHGATTTLTLYILPAAKAP